jgi:hypothetical protein
MSSSPKTTKTPTSAQPPMALFRNLAIGLIRLAGHTQIKRTLERIAADRIRILPLLAVSHDDHDLALALEGASVAIPCELINAQCRNDALRRHLTHWTDADAMTASSLIWCSGNDPLPYGCFSGVATSMTMSARPLFCVRR